MYISYCCADDAVYLTVMGERSEVVGEPVSWKHFNTSSASRQLLTEEEEEGGGATIWPNMRSRVLTRRTSFLQHTTSHHNTHTMY